MHPFFAGLSPTLHIAHRGGAALAPENTMAAFEQAVLRFGTQMLELDVQRTRDGVWVVAHDDTVDRCTDGTGDLSALTLADVRRLDAGFRFSPDGGRSFPLRGRGVRIPTLAEVLERFPEMHINVEVKRAPPGTEATFAEEIRLAGAESRICCGAADDALAARLFEHLPAACHFYPRDALAAFILSVRSGEAPPRDERFTALDMPLYFGDERLIDQGLLDSAREEQKWVNVWTVDDPAEMRRLIREGVGGIMTDRPDLLREALDEMSP